LCLKLKRLQAARFHPHARTGMGERSNEAMHARVAKGKKSRFD
jgi:hypothetical protein